METAEAPHDPQTCIGCQATGATNMILDAMEHANVPVPVAILALTRALALLLVVNVEDGHHEEVLEGTVAALRARHALSLRASQHMDGAGHA